MGLYIAVKITFEEAGWKTFTYMYYTYYEETMKNTVLTSRAHRTRVQFRLMFT